MKAIFYYESFAYFTGFHIYSKEPFFEQLEEHFESVPQELLTQYHNIQADYKKEVKKNKDYKEFIDLKYANKLKRANYDYFFNWYKEDVEDFLKKEGIYEDEKKAIDFLIKAIGYMRIHLGNCRDIAERKDRCSVSEKAGFTYYDCLIIEFMTEVINILGDRYSVKTDFNDDELTEFSNTVNTWCQSLDFAKDGRKRLDWTVFFLFYWLTAYTIVGHCEKNDCMKKVFDAFLANVAVKMFDPDYGISPIMVEIMDSVDREYNHMAEEK